jgi:hypothetical protein
VDWDVVAEKAGFSNGKTANTRFSQIKKKLGWTDENTALVGPKTPKASKDSGNKPKKGSGTNISPSKVTKSPKTPKTPKTPKSGGKKAKAVKADPVVETKPEIEEEEYGEEMGDVKEDMVYENHEDHAGYDENEDHEEDVIYYDTPDA